MPDVVVVVEVEQLALAVEMARGGWREDPGGGLVEEEVHGPRPGDGGQEDVDQGLSGDPLAVSQLHQDVECGVEQQVDDQDAEQEAGKVKSFILQLLDNLEIKMIHSTFSAVKSKRNELQKLAWWH